MAEDTAPAKRLKATDPDSGEVIKFQWLDADPPTAADIEAIIAEQREHKSAPFNPNKAEFHQGEKEKWKSPFEYSDKSMEEASHASTDRLKKIGTGFIKGVGQSGVFLSRQLNKTPDLGEKLWPKVGINELDKISETHGGYEKLGSVGEQLVEMAAGGRLVKPGIATLGAKAPTLIPAAEIITEGGINAGNAVLHGENPAAAGAIGSGFKLAGRVAPSIVPGLKKAGEKTYGQFIHATTNKNKDAAARIIPELISRGETGSAAGLRDKAASNVETLGKDIGDKIDAIDPKARLKVEPIIKQLEAFKQDQLVNGVLSLSNKAIYENADKFQKEVLEMAFNQPGPAMGKGTFEKFWNKNTDEMSYQSLNKLRKMWDKVVARAGGFGSTAIPIEETAKVEAMREGAGAIRELLSKDQPDIAKINKEFRLWITFSDLLDATIMRKVGQAHGLTPLIVGAAAGAGTLGHEGVSAAGGTSAATMAAIATILTHVVQSGRFRTMSAVTLDRLSQAAMSKDLPAILDITGRTSTGTIGQMTRPSIEDSRRVHP